MEKVIILISFLLVGLLIARILWLRFRLRRALFALRRQIVWSIRHAPRDKLVLEVGSGHNPSIRSDVLCDKYLHDDAHRAAGMIIDRPLVIGDASALPFRSGSFDVIIANHMIEHLDDPRPFFAEAGRVASRGLFTAPSAMSERLWSDPQHRWLVEQKGDTLHFTAKNQPMYDPAIQRFFQEEIVNSLLKLDYFNLNHWHALIITYIWEDHPRCTVDGEPNAIGFVEASTEEATVRRKLTGSEGLRGHLRTWARSLAHALFASGRRVDWTEILACPQCHGDVSVSANNVYCPTCDLGYPVDRGIPIMLIEHAVVGSRLIPPAQTDKEEREGTGLSRTARRQEPQ